MKEFDKLVNERLGNALNQASYEDERYVINYKYKGYDARENRMDAKRQTWYNMVVAVVTITDKLTKEEIHFTLNLFKMPVPTENGFKLGNGYSQIMSVTSLAGGWFIQEAKKGDGTSLKRDNEAEMIYNSLLNHSRYVFYSDNGILRYKPPGAGAKKGKVSELLQALTGKSQMELRDLLGDNKYIENSFSDDELTLNQAIENTADVFGISNKLPLKDKLHRIKGRLFRHDVHQVNKTAYVRYTKNTAFLKRALNQHLGEDITVGRKTYSEGTELTENLLKEIDEDKSIDTLYIQDGDFGTICLKKYQADPERFSVNELLTMINMFSLVLSGYGTYDSIYDNTSRIVLSYEDRVINYANELLNNMTEELLGEITATYHTERINKTLYDAVTKFKRENVDTFIDRLKADTSDFTPTTSNTNTLSYVSVNSKTVSQNGGTAAKDEIRVQEHERNRYDPIDQPESPKIGKVHYPTLLVQTDELGNQLVPYYKVVNGEPTDEIVYITAAEEEGEYVAVYEEDFSGEFVKAFYGGSAVDVPKNQVKYKECAPHSSIGVARSCIPFGEFNNSKRLLMGSNHQKQAVHILGAERPIVSTGTFGLLDCKPPTARQTLEEYYNLNKGNIKCDKETFCNLRIKLTGTSILQGEREAYFDILDAEGFMSNPKSAITVRYPFMKKSEVETVYSNEINPKPDNIYQGDDVIYSSITVSIDKKDMVECVDYGAFPPDNYDQDFALGKNLLVAYKTHEGSTIEDAIVIRKGLCYSDLISVSLVEYKYECFTDDEYTESFGVVGTEPEDYILKDGLPKMGTYLTPGDVIMYKKRTYNDGREFTVSRRLSSTASGEVVAREISADKTRAVVTLAKFNTMESGDKMSGRYGNKGVVAKIVPDEEMPYLEETGEIIDIILNPLGIPSRMNLGQALEIILGRAAQKEGKHCVISPYNKNSLDFVKGMREKHKVYPQRLIDGRTGLPFERPVEVGIEYMLTLHQKVRGKTKSVAKTGAIDQSNGQPQASTGAQALGEMETWTLAVAGCDKLLQDLFTTQSDDWKSSHDLDRMIESNAREITIDGDNRNNIVIQAVLLCLGIKLRNDENGEIVFDIVTDNDIRALADAPLNTKDRMSLHDAEIFGDPKKPAYERSTQFGYVDLNCEIVNPNVLKTSSVLYSIPIYMYNKKEGKYESKFLTKQTIERITLGTGKNSYGIAKRPNPDGLGMFYISSADAFDNVDTGIEAIVEILKTMTIDKVLEIYDHPEYRCNDTMDDLNKARESLLAWKESGYDFKDFIITSFPVLPEAFRNSILEKKQIHDLESLYIYLFNAINAVSANSNKTTIRNVFTAVGDIIGTGSLSEKKSVAGFYFGRGSESSNSSKGKNREQVLKKRVNFSGRSVIIPNDYKMPVTHIGVPIDMAFNIWKLHLISILKSLPRLQEILNQDLVPRNQWYESLLTYLQTKNFYRFRSKINEYSLYSLNLEEAKVLFQDIKDVLIEFLEQQTVVAGRQPTLHQYGIRAYKVKIVESKAIGINTLVCSGYNADFDGDTMYIIAVLDKDTAEDTMKKLTVKQTIVNPKDSGSVINLTQDMLLGIYVATMLYDNEESIEGDPRYEHVHFVRDLDLLSLMIELGDLTMHDLVCITYDGRDYLSTAGRILFNSMVPGGFTDRPFSNVLGVSGVKEGEFYDLLYDGLISKKGKSGGSKLHYESASSVLFDIYKQYADSDIDLVFNTYQKMMEFGFMCSDKSGITLGVTDFYGDLYNSTPTSVGTMKTHVTDKYKDIYREKELQINKAIARGFISTDARSEMLQSLGSSLNQKVQKDANSNLPRNNNLFIISDSGARGNAGQIGQSIGMAGTKMKTLTTSFDIPILNSYAEGLTTYEMLMDAFASRQGVASTQLNTGAAGYALRQMIYMVNALSIHDDDCGASPMEIDVEYAELFRIRKYDADGNELEVITNNLEDALDDLVGKRINSYVTDLNRNYLLNFVDMDIFSKDTIHMLLKKHIHQLVIDNVTYHFDYKMTKFFKMFLKNRYLVTNDERIRTAALYADDTGAYMTDESISIIEDMNLNQVSIRTTLTCECPVGCCKKCYGLMYATDQLPYNEQKVGIESAQSIGEPVQQLTMSLFHGGGAAGGSVTNGVTLNNNLIEGRLPKDDRMSAHVVGDSFVDVITIGNSAVINVDNEYNQGSISSPIEALDVESGEYVRQFEAVTKGFTEFNSLGVISLKQGVKYNISSAYILEDDEGTTALVRLKDKDNPIFMRGETFSHQDLNQANSLVEASNFKKLQQMALLKLYNWNFSKEDIDVLPRHFELLVKVQTQTVKIVNTNMPGIVVGNLYNYYELKRMRKPGEYFIYPLAVARKAEVVTLNSGPISSIMFERYKENLQRIMSTRQQIPENSFISKLAIGQSLAPKDKNRTKDITGTFYKNRRPSVKKDPKPAIVDVKEFHFQEQDFDLFSDILKMDINVEPVKNDTPKPEPTIVKEDVEKAPSSKTKTMNLFDE